MKEQSSHNRKPMIQKIEPNSKSEFDLRGATTLLRTYNQIDSFHRLERRILRMLKRPGYLEEERELLGRRRPSELCFAADERPWLESVIEVVKSVQLPNLR